MPPLILYLTLLLNIFNSVPSILQNQETQKTLQSGNLKQKQCEKKKDIKLRVLVLETFENGEVGN